MVSVVALIFALFYYAVNTPLAGNTALEVFILFLIATVVLAYLEERSGNGKGGA